ncbi:flagellar assembly protein FliW [Bacillus sp. CGMCC 1.16541]|uniref:flagellar assembly protein FliW n=1 Tax=Bacillus sp. CGMCC 1.16541 TaxID=2185143 RepID=UPI000D739725|nr:flagellar assembly protein FliW [Bacillus sp. CGMCC 1.16541]
MNIKTKYHGSMEVKKQDILHFHDGLPGFVEEKTFIVLPLGDDNVFYFLQSTQTPNLGFVITNPFLFFKEYDFELDTSHLQKLEIKDEEHVAVYTILTMTDQIEQSTANLQAPIVINTKTNKAKQIILTNTSYKTKHSLAKQSIK